MYQRTENADLLLHAVRIIGDLYVQRMRDAECHRQLFHGAALLLLARPVQAADVIDVFPARELFVDGMIVRHISDEPLCLFGLPHDVISLERNGPLVEGQDARHRFDDRRLARAVAADQPADFASFRYKIDLFGGIGVVVSVFF